METAHSRLRELLPHLTPRLAYQKRPEIAQEIVQQLEEEGQCPQAPDTCDNGLLTLE